MGEGLLTSWQQHKIQRKNGRKKYAQKNHSKQIHNANCTPLPPPPSLTLSPSLSFARVGLLTLQQPGSDVGSAVAAFVPLLSAMSAGGSVRERDGGQGEQHNE